LCLCLHQEEACLLALKAFHASMIRLENASVRFTVLDPRNRSLRRKLVQTATGGALGKNSRGDTTVNALTDLDLIVHSGERLGIVGHNGAGKTTLLRVLGRIYEPTSGSVQIEGKVCSLINLSLGTDPESTGRENVLLRAAFLGVSRDEALARMDEIIKFSGLGDFIDLPVRTYSTGMLLRLAFAVSTITPSDILLMDEWLSVGDSEFRRKAEERMQEVLSNSKILVLASHSPDLILRHCTRAIWLEHGRIKMDGAPSEVLEDYRASASTQVNAGVTSVGFPKKLQTFVMDFWPHSRLKGTSWLKIQGFAIAAFVQLTEGQGGLPKLPEPSTKYDHRLLRCLTVACQICRQDIPDEEIHDALGQLAFEDAEELLAQCCYYFSDQRSVAFWISAIKQVMESARLKDSSSSRLAARLTALEASPPSTQSGPSSPQAKSIVPLNMLVPPATYLPLSGDLDTATPAPALNVIIHTNKETALGESISFGDLSFTDDCVAVINGRYMAPNYDRHRLYVGKSADLHPASSVDSPEICCLPAWYSGTDCEFLQLTQLFPSICLASELRISSCTIYANLTGEVLEKLQTAGKFFGITLPDIEPLSRLMGTPSGKSDAWFLLTRALPGYCAHLRGRVMQSRWGDPARSERAVFLSASPAHGSPAVDSAEFRTALRSFGVEPVPIDELSFLEQCELFSSCGKIIACEAKHSGKMIFSHPQSRFLELAGGGWMSFDASRFATEAGLGSYTRNVVPFADRTTPCTRSVLQLIERHLAD
jgi:lipopolysaccharide transport system ATP-binding protein